MNVANIISIIGNNTSIYPILFKDGIESSSKDYLADKQGKKVSKEQGFYEARESAIEEFGSTGVWFLTPIAVAKAFNGISSKIFGLKNHNLLKADTQLLDGKHYQTLEKNINQFGDTFEKEDVKKLSSSKLSKMIKGRGILGSAIAIGLLAGLTLFKQKVTKDSIEKHGAPKGVTFEGQYKQKMQNSPAFSSVIHNDNKGEISFKGIRQLVEQATIDAGVGTIRVTTARDKDEKKEYVFNTVAFLALNYLTAPIIEKPIAAIAKHFGLPVGLDAKVITDKDFAKDVLEASKNTNFKENMTSFVSLEKSDSAQKKEEKIIKFIDEELKKAKYNENGDLKAFNNATLEAARKTGLIETNKNKRSINKFIDTVKIEKINGNIKELIDSVAKKPNMDGVFKKLKASKYASVLVNIAICSTLVGIVLPKMRYMFREKGIGTVASPGVKAYDRHHHKTKPKLVKEQS